MSAERSAFFDFLEKHVDKVSRETCDLFDRYADTLLKWQSKINLIGPKTVDNIWQRHFLDSAQLLPLLPKEPGRILDIGSGAGFPGMVMAILLRHCLESSVTLVESDARKCAFLTTIAASFQGPVIVQNCRIEEFDAPEGFDVVVARALAPLPELLTYVEPFCRRTSQCIFLKGLSADEEVKKARERWYFDVHARASVTNDSGQILTVTNIRHR